MHRLRSVVVAVVAGATLAGCIGPVTAPAAPDVAMGDRPADDAAPPPAPAGRVVVAQPDPVGVWWQQDVGDVAAGDLAPLWTLPLYRWDELGRLQPALAVASREVPVPDGWGVEVDLARGSWSDGTPVRAGDVVATATALAAARPAAWSAWQAAEVVDDDTVRLVFDRPFAGWSTLLSVPPGVLPAHRLEGEGLDAWSAALPVTGGWFTLADHQPGVSATFAAHADGPLGPPGLATVEVLVVPLHETALGLVERGEADVVLGHVVLDAPGRRADLPGLAAAEVFGGTRFELVWPDDAATREVRRAAAAGLDPVPFVEGLMRDSGRVPGGVTPAYRAVGVPPTDATDATDGAVVVQLPRTVEGLGLLARRLQTDLQGAGVSTTLVRLDPPEHLDPPVATDGRLRVVRVPPGRSLAGLLGELGLDTGPGLRADAAGVAPLDAMTTRADPPAHLVAVHELLQDDPRLVVLAEVAVTHVWDPAAVEGLRPSAWPGVGLWNVGTWRAPTGP